ncbi:NAD(P)/FAD-dependent oxidoreductase [Amycolatopsis taiwanensis]|uniref:Dehydrogenase n=1 Tax=Amycolatopsis taiwanensis TaxID=342230 RepID=A0A9W6VFH3_9PSEU|nr:NAD(P)/FAD-dependent oxidoreductase [Amycolatopsis taiwanensis]GLY69608.1 dehydrogenase [Amycolatopsis taiwanensis]
MSTGIGRDRRIVEHRAPAGAPDAAALSERPHAVVVGAGVAGFAAATGLAERGVRVTVIEREEHLGGRVASWTECANVSMSRGFHAFFRQYYNLRSLLRRADPTLSGLVPLADYPLIDAHGRRDGFRGLPRTPPWNALAFALRSPTFRFRDLLALDVKAAAPLAAVSVPEIYSWLDGVDSETFLRAINFPAAARHLAFEVFSRSFFMRPDEMSAAELATMFHIYFLGSSEGLTFDVPSASFAAALWAPLRAYLAEHGVEFRTGVAVTEVDTTGTRAFRVHEATGETTEADGVVLATDVAGLRRIVASSSALAHQPWRARVAGLRNAPPFLVLRLWLDRPVARYRPAFLAAGGLEPLDNISVLDRYEREASDWAQRHHGSVVELHAYAAGTRSDVPEREHVRDLRRRLIARLHSVYPETVPASVVTEAAAWHADCPRFGVGEFATRPRVHTPFDGLVVAGDGIRIDLPVALMERAASTGWHAANRLLAGWGLAGHPLYSVPTRGRVAPLRWLAAKRKVGRSCGY